MKYIVVIFTSRTDTMHFYSLIKKYNGFCSIINTPHSLVRSCGISVKISYSLVNISKQILSNNHFSSFKGIFEISIVNNKDIPVKIY